jgi:hypothetical protein
VIIVPDKIHYKRGERADTVVARRLHPDDAERYLRVLAPLMDVTIEADPRSHADPDAKAVLVPIRWYARAIDEIRALDGRALYEGIDLEA